MDNANTVYNPKNMPKIDYTQYCNNSLKISNELTTMYVEQCT